MNENSQVVEVDRLELKFYLSHFRAAVLQASHIVLLILRFLLLKLDCSEIKNVKMPAMQFILTDPSVVLCHSFDIAPIFPEFSQITHFVSDTSAGFFFIHQHWIFFFFFESSTSPDDYFTLSSFKDICFQFSSCRPIFPLKIIFNIPDFIKHHDLLGR